MELELVLAGIEKPTLSTQHDVRRSRTPNLNNVRPASRISGFLNANRSANAFSKRAGNSLMDSIESSGKSAAGRFSVDGSKVLGNAIVPSSGRHAAHKNPIDMTMSIARENRVEGTCSMGIRQNLK